MTTTAPERRPSTVDARERFIRAALADAPPMSAERRHRIATVLFGQGD